MSHPFTAEVNLEVSSRSPRRSPNFELLIAPARNSWNPVEKLSYPTTVSPRKSNASTRLLPTKPPPVTKAFNMPVP